MSKKKRTPEDWAFYRRQLGKQYAGGKNRVKILEALDSTTGKEANANRSLYLTMKGLNGPGATELDLFYLLLKDDIGAEVAKMNRATLADIICATEKGGLGEAHTPVLTPMGMSRLQGLSSLEASGQDILRNIAVSTIIGDVWDWIHEQKWPIAQS